MSESVNSRPAPVASATLDRREQAAAPLAKPDLGSVITWLKTNRVLAAGLLMILADVIWKAQLLQHHYFYQEDYVDSDIARKSAFSWHYLTLVSGGHFFIGLRAITWVLARVSLYNWALASGVLLALAAGAGVAALRLLRTLFGDRRAILIPLAIYLLSPLTVPDFGWWWAGMESLPLQLAIFMALHAHIRYIRAGGRRNLIEASAWLVVGMLFFDKAVVLPVLLLAITSAFLTETRSWAAGLVRTLRQHWRAWVSYAALMTGYGALYIEAFRASAAQASPSGSTSGVLTFASAFVRDTALPGAVGGPWAWLPAGPGHVYAIAHPPGIMVWLASLIALAVVAFSIWAMWAAWRAWMIFALWVVLADAVPVVVGRLGFGFYTLFGLDTRYLADAVPVLAICVGLAFFPVAGMGEAAPAAQDLKKRVLSSQAVRYAATALVGVFVAGSFWSNQAYENITSGASSAASYMANAEQALANAAPGTTVLDRPVPGTMVMPLFFGPAAAQSQVIGSLETGSLAGRLRWIGQAQGMIDNLRMFGGDGRLYRALISGVYTLGRSGKGLASCWPEKDGEIKVTFPRTTTPADSMLFISYIWNSAPAVFSVQYGNVLDQFTTKVGIHNVYLPVTGYVRSFYLYGSAIRGLCVGGAASGVLVPY